MAINQENQETSYKKEYCFDVVIQQLRKDAILDLGFSFSFGPINVSGDIITPDQISYTCVLEDAFPTSMNAQEFTNDQGGQSELSVQLSYSNWKSRSGGPLGFLANLIR